jgi:hypothetical protein
MSGKGKMLNQRRQINLMKYAAFVAACDATDQAHRDSFFGKLKRWRGFSGIYGLQPAPALGFGDFIRLNAA